MPSIEINFNQEVNTSVQVGDEVYYIIPNTNGEFDWADKSNIFRIEDTATSPPPPYYVSDVSEGLPAFITVDFPTNVGLTLNIPPDGAFIMFGKNNKVNEAGLKGYYAKAKFQNNSKKRAELFMVNSEVTPSSQ